MKKIAVAFPRNRYTSDKDGNVQTVQLPHALLQPIGSSDNMLWEVTVYAKSSANARLELTVYEGTKPDPRPSQNRFSGVTIGSPSPLSVSSLYMTTLAITAPYAGLIDAILGVKSNSPTTDVQEWMDAEVRVTLAYS